MEIALLAELDADPCLKAFEAQEWTNPADHPCVLSRSEWRSAETFHISYNMSIADFYRKLTSTVDAVFYQQFMDSGTPGPR